LLSTTSEGACPGRYCDPDENEKKKYGSINKRLKIRETKSTKIIVREFFMFLLNNETLLSKPFLLNRGFSIA
jgi:hypothetical protein